MNGLLLLIPIALALGLGGLATFLWALRAGQFEDLEGAGGRILFDDDEREPPPASTHSRRAP
jgi:cbb3-type cytochrome oxidase maturation protein